MIEINEVDLWATIGKQGFELEILRKQTERQNVTIARLLGENRDLRDAAKAPAQPGGSTATTPRTITGPDGQVFEPIERASSHEEFEERLRRNGHMDDLHPDRCPASVN